MKINTSKAIFLLGLIFLLSLNLALAEDCVWRNSMKANSLYNTLYEDSGTIYLGTNGKIYSSTDFGEKFAVYSQKSDSSALYLNKVNSELIVGAAEGAYKISSHNTWVKFLDKDPLVTLQRFELFGDTLYASDGFGRIIYKEGTDTSSTVGKLTATIPNATEIISLVSDGTNLWAATMPESFLYYSSLPAHNWIKKTINVPHVERIEFLQFHGGDLFAPLEFSNGDVSLYYSRDSGNTWKPFSKQIPEIQRYYGLDFFGVTVLALVQLEDGSVKVYGLSGTEDWKEYGLDLSLSQGKDILKMSDGGVLVIGGTLDDKNVVAKCKANQAPMAGAGEDQTVFVGEKVILSGTAVDPENDSLTYIWEQPGSTIVSLDDADTANPSFTATKAGSYVFQFTAEDKYGAKGTDTVTVKVLPGEKYFLELTGTITHHSWMIGKNYPSGKAYLEGNALDSDLSFKISGESYLVQNLPADAGMYTIYKGTDQEFIFYPVTKFDYAEIYLRTGDLFANSGDTLTAKIRKGSLDGTIVAEASQFVEKALSPKWVKFVFAQSLPETQPPTEEETGSSSSGSSSGSSGGGSSSSSGGYYPECTKDSDCGSGKVCKSNACVKKEMTTETPKTNVSAPGESKKDNTTAVLSCAKSEDCPADKFCSEKKCEALNCKAGEEIKNHQCVTSTTVSEKGWPLLAKILAGIGALVVLAAAIIIGIFIGTRGKKKGKAAGKAAAKTSQKPVAEKAKSKGKRKR